MTQPTSDNPKLHPLLLRQLRRLGLDALEIDAWPAPWAELVQRVHRTYTDADNDRYLLERSQTLANAEMGALHAQLQASQARLANLVALSSDWVWEVDADGRFTYLSDHMIRTGLDPERLIGLPLEVDLLPPVDGHDPAELNTRMTDRRPIRDFVFGVPWPNRPPVYVRISGDPVFEGDVFCGYRGVASDVTAATLANQQVIRLARFDGLTGLANRAMFLSELDRLLVRARHAGHGFGVLFIDLDRFKRVNDTLGHQAGDELLKTMAGRLTDLLRPCDMVARLGGDEFVVLIDENDDAAALAALARRLLAALDAPLNLSGQTVRISGSIGISRYPHDGDEAASLLQAADTAMYAAKSCGKNNCQFFDARQVGQDARLPASHDGGRRLAQPQDQPLPR